MEFQQNRTTSFITQDFSVARTELAGLNTVQMFLPKRVFDLVSVRNAYSSGYATSAT